MLSDYNLFQLLKITFIQQIHVELKQIIKFDFQFIVLIQKLKKKHVFWANMIQHRFIMSNNSI